MKILVLNCGSASLKYQLFRMSDESILAKGIVDRIGLPGSSLVHQPKDKDEVIIEEEITDHSRAIEMVLSAIIDSDHGVIRDMREISAIGHRIVHGGATFSSAVLVDDSVIQEIRRLAELAPLHNPAAIMGINACRKHIPNTPMVVVFDTAFHQSMPPRNYLYGLPYQYYEKYAVRRYGAHGTSHRFVSMRAAELLGKSYYDSKVITCHLGNGASVTAVDGGRVLNTSMGFTPLEGLLMGTRCGDIDPAVIPFLMKKEKLSPDNMNNIMNKHSGLLGISGVSSDMRAITEAIEQGNRMAMMALSVFVRQVLHYIGAYILELGGADAIVFTAGIGENSIIARRDICRQLGVIGADFDEEANECRGVEKEISLPSSKVKLYVIPTNEELMIARDTLEIIYQKKMGMDRFF